MKAPVIIGFLAVIAVFGLLMVVSTPSFLAMGYVDERASGFDSDGGLQEVRGSPLFAFMSSWRWVDVTEQGRSKAVLRTLEPYDDNDDEGGPYVGSVSTVALCSDTNDENILYVYRDRFDSWEDFWDYASCDDSGCENSAQSDPVSFIGRVERSVAEDTVFVCYAREEQRNTGTVDWAASARSFYDYRVAQAGGNADDQIGEPEEESGDEPSEDPSEEPSEAQNPIIAFFERIGSWIQNLFS